LTAFGALFVPAPLREAVSDHAWLEAMLDVERALANAQAIAGVAPPAAVAAIAAACEPELYDVGHLAEQGRAVGNPAEPLVRALRDRVGGDAARYVHYGATSQDVMDSASMLVARRANQLIDVALDDVARACAALAENHRRTAMAGRTLLQQAVPTTFGLKAAGWLTAVADARERLAAVPLAAELGGAAGTLARLGEHATEVLRLFAAELELPEPVLPWHAHRGRVAALGAALAAVAAACAKIGLDVVLLAQTEIAEVSESSNGRSSTMPHKRNPVGAVLARACARGVHAQATLLTSGEHEHERAAGAWQAEWGAMSEALALAGGAAAAIGETLHRLQVHPDRMRANMSDELVSERLAFAERAGLDVADELRDPTTYLGSAPALVDRALARYRDAR
jgi:3-carboxy-cis,cis-muconate cycloisomerase